WTCEQWLRGAVGDGVRKEGSPSAFATAWQGHWTLLPRYNEVSNAMRTCITVLSLLVCAGVIPRMVHAQQPVNVAPNAPVDHPVSMDSCIIAAVNRAVAPLIARAKATYPDAKARFLRGLPPKHSFFVITRLHDSLGRFEQVFVAVDSIRADATRRQVIVGRIWSPIHLVTGYQLKQRYIFPEADLVDWLIARPDGSEEGNLVGNFMDTWQPPATCRP
ncbi:MAG: hypothetical protein ABJC19_11780, partial [Gemmatimonadota bacterium]